MSSSVFYYLGLEASQRDNRYLEYEEAYKDALYASKRRGIPIRIFRMLPNNKSEMVQAVTPKDSGPLSTRCRKPSY